MDERAYYRLAVIGFALACALAAGFGAVGFDLLAGALL